jgi:hypothetical protein
MDVGIYLASQAAAYWYTSPKLQAAARAAGDIYISVKTEWGPAIQVIAAGMAMSEIARDLVMHGVAITADPNMLHGFDPTAEHYALEANNIASGTAQQIDAVKDAVKDTADNFLMEGRKEQEDLRREQDKIAQDPEKLEAEKQEAGKLEAQWAARRQADEQDRLTRQQEADQKVADRLGQDLRKDQEIRSGLEPVKQPENPAGPKPEDPRLAALDKEHRERLHHVDETAKQHEAGLTARHQGDPALEGLLQDQQKRAEAYRESVVKEQATQRKQLEQQITSPVPPPPIPPPPTR